MCVRVFLLFLPVCEWVYEYMRARMHDHMSVWIFVCEFECMNVNIWVCECASVWVLHLLCHSSVMLWWDTIIRTNTESLSVERRERERREEVTTVSVNGPSFAFVRKDSNGYWRCVYVWGGIHIHSLIQWSGQMNLELKCRIFNTLQF